MNKRFIFSLLLKSLLVILAMIGVYITLNMNNDFMGSLKGLAYFTIQSNIWIMIVFIIFIVLSILEHVKKKKYISNTLLIIKFVFTVAISVTFIVFFTMLTSSVPISYLLSVSNLTVHFLVPIIAIIDMFIFDYQINMKRYTFLYGALPNLAYLTFALMLSTVENFYFSEGMKVPYFFLDYEKLGWFTISSKGLGVFYWIIILCIGIILLCLLYKYLLNKIKIKKSIMKT